MLTETFKYLSPHIYTQTNIVVGDIFEFTDKEKWE